MRRQYLLALAILLSVSTKSFAAVPSGGGTSNDPLKGLVCDNPVKCASEIGKSCAKHIGGGAIGQCMQKINPSELGNVKEQLKKFTGDFKKKIKERREEYLAKFNDISKNLGQIDNNLDKAFENVKKEAESRLAEYKQLATQFESLQKNIESLKISGDMFQRQAQSLYPKLHDIIGKITVKPDTLTALQVLTGKSKEDLVKMKGDFDGSIAKARDLQARIDSFSLESWEAKAGEKLSQLKSLTTQDLLALGAQIAPIRDAAGLSESQLGQAEGLLTQISTANNKEAAIALISAFPANPEFDMYRTSALALAQKYKPAAGGGDPVLDQDARKGIGAILQGVQNTKAEKSALFTKLDAQHKSIMETITGVNGASDHVEIAKMVTSVVSKHQGMAEEFFQNPIDSKTVLLNSINVLKNSGLTGISAQNLLTAESQGLLTNYNNAQSLMNQAIALLNGAQPEYLAKEMALHLAQTALKTVMGDLLGDFGQLLANVHRDLQFLSTGLSDAVFRSLVLGSFAQFDAVVMSKIKGCMRPVTTCASVLQVLPTGGIGSQVAQLLRPFLGTIGSGGKKRSKQISRSLRSLTAFERTLRRAKVEARAAKKKASTRVNAKSTVNGLKKLSSSLSSTIASGLEVSSKELMGQPIGSTSASLSDKMRVLEELARAKGYL